MLVVSQFDDVIFEFQKPLRYSVDGVKGRVFAVFPDGQSEQLGAYDSKEHARYALGQLMSAYNNCCRVFYMPSAVEVRGELMNRHCKPVRCTGAGNSHGGT